MTPKNEAPNAMEALDRALEDGPLTEATDNTEAVQAVEDDREMPLGFEQIDSDLTPAQIRKIRANMYFFHGIVGVLLLPFALLLRAGRWSMRTLVCHHNGDEFGGF